MLAQTTASETVMTIAIVPCVITDLGVPQHQISPQEAYVLEGSRSGLLQRNLYLHLAEYLEASHSNTIQLQPVTDTNTLLEFNGISLRESWKMTIPELAEILGVDAILWVSISYAAGSVTRISGTADNPGAPNDDNGLLMTPNKTLVSAALLDAKLGNLSPIWNRSNYRLRSRRGKGNKAVARRIARRLARNLPPVRDQYLYTQSE